MTVKQNAEVAIRSIENNLKHYDGLSGHNFSGIDYRIFYHKEAYNYIINYLRNRNNKDYIIEGNNENGVPKIIINKKTVEINSLGFDDELDWNKVSV